MPKNRVCANSESVAIRNQPVSIRENKDVGGNALSCDTVFEQDMHKISALRDRQSQFLATLPSEPQQALDISFNILHPDFGDYIEGFEEALHLSQALTALIAKGDLDQNTSDHEAAQFVSRQVANHLEQTRCQLDYLSHVLGNPGRVERDGAGRA